MNCPYEFPSGECSVHGEVPEDAECERSAEDGNEHLPVNK